MKAAFLFNFAKFVEWPDSAPAAAGEFAICVVGEAKVVRQVETVVAGKSAGGSPVAVRGIASVAASKGCHIVFVTDGSAPGASGSGSGVLTVGQEAGFARDGGMINFVIVDQKVRFEVNKRSAEAAGLSISSHLLKLAHDVIE